MTAVEQYISTFPPEIQDRLNEIRGIFFEELPHTKESIRYKIPSTEKIKENGIGLVELFRPKMEKFEELTLNLIKLNDRLNKLESENKLLKSR